ncbi:MAG: methyltransferase domain-containing protein [bacterium]
MKKYLSHTFEIDDKELISVIDELPLWSAPFGLSLLDTIKIGKGMKVLDIGSGLGFPMIEIAQRLGESSVVYGIDPWEPANERARKKAAKYGIKNVEVINGAAENLPFENSYFDLIVSNNGINNVSDLLKTLEEIRRVSKKGAQFVFTMNLEDTMIEFYNALREELEIDNDTDAITKVREHIYQKRRPVSEIVDLLQSCDFGINSVKEDIFYLRFADAETMFNYSLIKYWFLGSWKSLVATDKLEDVFERVEMRLNEIASSKNEIKLSVPFISVDCETI